MAAPWRIVTYADAGDPGDAVTAIMLGALTLQECNQAR